MKEASLADCYLVNAVSPRLTISVTASCLIFSPDLAKKLNYASYLEVYMSNDKSYAVFIPSSESQSGSIPCSRVSNTYLRMNNKEMSKKFAEILGIDLASQWAKIGGEFQESVHGFVADLSRDPNHVFNRKHCGKKNAPAE
jgi:hypothetical protein